MSSETSIGITKNGTGHFIAQRVSAIALALLGIWFLLALINLDSFTYLDVIRFVAQTINSLLLVLLCLTMSYHSYLGVQVIIDDYVHAHRLALFSLIVSRTAHIVVAIVSVYAVAQIWLDA